MAGSAANAGVDTTLSNSPKTTNRERLRLKAIDFVFMILIKLPKSSSED
jgi:hypothetical protein